MGPTSIALVAVLAASAACAESGSVPAYQNPIIGVEQGGVADPGVLRDDDGRYYMVGTGGAEAGTYPLRASDDLVQWDELGYLFPDGTAPDWMRGTEWAPEIHRVGDHYEAFFTATAYDDDVQSLGVALADAPTGPWIDRGEPILSGDPIGKIDSTYFRDPLDGRHYMLWKHEDNGFAPDHGTPLFAQELSADGLSLIGRPSELIRNDLDWEEGVVEGPWMVFHDGYYVLFYSGNSYGDWRYATGVARSRRRDVSLGDQLASIVAGPRLDKLDDPILSSAEDDCWWGPGHGSVVVGPDGADYYVYHAWQNGRSGQSAERLGMLDRIDWVAGWPRIGDGKPSIGACDDR